MFDLSSLTLNELLEAFNVILSKPGSLTDQDLYEIDQITRALDAGCYTC